MLFKMHFDLKRTFHINEVTFNYSNSIGFCPYKCMSTFTYDFIHKTFSVGITATLRITYLIFACIFPVI